MIPLDVLSSAALGGAAVILVSLAASALPRIRLSTRRALLVAGLAVAALAPAAAFAGNALGSGFLPAATPPPAAPAHRVADISAGETLAPPIAPSPWSPPAPSPTRTAPPPPARPAPARPVPWPALAAWTWLAGSVWALVSIGIGLGRCAALRRASRVSSDPRLAGLYVSDALSVPATIGLSRPVIVLPQRVARELSDEDLAAVRRHEASHVGRRDPLAGLVARIARALQWPNPFAHWAVRRLDVLCEEIADAEAVAGRPASAAGYASCLVRIAEGALASRIPAGAHGIVGGRRLLTRRVASILDPTTARDPRPSWRGRFAAAGLAVFSLALAACCCRAPVRAPCLPRTMALVPTSATRNLIRPGVGSGSLAFSPVAGPVDPATGAVAPTYTDPYLTVNVDPRWPGRIAVRFAAGTRVDPASLFVGGDPALGVDLSAAQILSFIPGTGNVPVEGHIDVEPDAIVFTPSRLPLANGQYTVAVFPRVRGLDGKPATPSPTFHSFTVGVADTAAPVVVVTDPMNGAYGIPAGLSGAGAPRVEGVRTDGGIGSPDLVVRFSEAIDPSSVTDATVRVEDLDAFVPGGREPPRVPSAPAFPRLRSSIEDPAARASRAFEVVWRADPAAGGFPFGTRIRVTIVGSDGGVQREAVRDLAGNALERSYAYVFTTVPPPDLRSGR